jgi:uncharacterized protein (DUF488 family)
MNRSAAQQPAAVFTIAHSPRSIEDFLEPLHVHGVACLLDVRTVPRSRHNPQFNRDTFPEALQQAGIDYAYAGTQK